MFLIKENNGKGWVLSLGCGEQETTDWEYYTDFYIPKSLRDMMESGASLTKMFDTVKKIISYGVQKEVNGAKALMSLLLQQVCIHYH